MGTFALQSLIRQRKCALRVTLPPYSPYSNSTTNTVGSLELQVIMELVDAATSGAARLGWKQPSDLVMS